MVRLAARATITLIAVAIAMITASILLSGMSIDGAAFVVSVVVFALVTMLIDPLLRQTALNSVPALLGSTALVATLIGLIVTDLLTDGLHMSGALTWILGTVIMWLVAMLCELLLPLVLFKRVLAESRARRGRTA